MRLTARGFTVVELLIVIVVMGVLATLVIMNVFNSQERTYFSRANAELKTFENALKLYAEKHNDYPEDANRGLPAGLEEFIVKNDQNSEWPKGPWPGSIYDYDRWVIDGVDTYQISIRFCPAGGPLSECKFPKQDWAKDFNVNSAVYFCIEGNCRSHSSEPASYPGYCVNCPNNRAIGT